MSCQEERNDARKKDGDSSQTPQRRKQYKRSTSTRRNRYEEDADLLCVAILALPGEALRLPRRNHMADQSLF